MPDTINAWLAVVGGIGGALSALIVWGFASGRFIQKRTDEFDNLEKRHSALADRVATNDGSLADIKQSLHRLREEIHRDFGKMQLTYELLSQRVTHHKERHDEHRERIEDSLTEIDKHVDEIQRQLDHLR